ncbi:MAG: DUF4493 domain-containing protein [Muribaculaceae bacterium]|nr:DUF4493 domain-containing protein [Muribaculaceae bacterium]
MKPFRYLSLVTILIMTTLAGCKDESWEKGENQETQYGSVSLARLNLEIVGITTSITARSPQIELNDFIIDVKPANSGVVYSSMSYSDVVNKGSINLPIGNYQVIARSASFSKAAFESPYYEGTSETFAIRPDELTIVETIQCYVTNIAVQVVIEDNLLEKIDLNRTTVTVFVDEKNPLQFQAEHLFYTGHEGVEGYFEYAANSMVARFESYIDNNKVEYEQYLSQLDKGQRRILTYSLKDNGVQPNPGSGSPYPGEFVIDVSVTEEPIVNVVIDGQEDPTIDPGIVERPGDNGQAPDGGNDNPGGNTGDNEKDKPGTNDNVIRFESSTLNLEALNNAGEYGEGAGLKDAILKIYADNGIANLNVTIDSKEVLTAEVLEEVGLPTKFDLANPATEHLREVFISLGFITEDGVKGKTAADFDVTQFLPLIPALGSGESDFIIEVVDLKGNSKSVTLRVWSD